MAETPVQAAHAHQSTSFWWTRVEGLFGRSPDSGLPDKSLLRGGGRVGNGSEAALLQACTVGSKEGVERLLLEGASPNHRGEFGATPLTISAELGSTSIVALLLAAGAEVDTIDDTGDSALLCACRVGQVDVVRMLLNAKADPALTNSQQKNALDAAIEARNYYNRPEVSELLLAHQRDDAEAATDAGAAGADEASDSTPKPGAPAPAGHLSSHAARGRPTDALELVLRHGSGTSHRSGTTSPVAPVLRLRKEEWALDRNYPQCHLCKATFTLINRRHHCRICALIFCEACTANTVATAGARTVRTAAGSTLGDPRPARTTARVQLRGHGDPRPLRAHHHARCRPVRLALLARPRQPAPVNAPVNAPLSARPARPALRLPCPRRC